MEVRLLLPSDSGTPSCPHSPHPQLSACPSTVTTTVCRAPQATCVHTPTCSHRTRFSGVNRRICLLTLNAPCVQLQMSTANMSCQDQTEVYVSAWGDTTRDRAEFACLMSASGFSSMRVGELRPMVSPVPSCPSAQAPSQSKCLQQENESRSMKQFAMPVGYLHSIPSYMRCHQSIKRWCDRDLQQPAYYGV